MKVGHASIPSEFDTKGAMRGAEEDWWAQLEQEGMYAGSIWYQFSLRVEALAGESKAFRSRLLPRSMLVLLGVLGALLVFGAVVPMGYLEARGGSSKVYLLGAFAVFSIAVVLVLGYEMISIRRAADLDRETF